MVQQVHCASFSWWGGCGCALVFGAKAGVTAVVGIDSARKICVYYIIHAMNASVVGRR